MQLRHFLQLIRWKNLLILALTQGMVACFLLKIPPDLKLLVLLISTLAVAAAGYIINDYFDVKIDVINKPQAVVIDKLIKRRSAMLIHQFLNIVGLILGLCLGKSVFLINLLTIILLWFYSERLKQQAFIGNFVVALLTALSLLIVAVLYDTGYELTGIYAFFAFAITLIREVIKDMEDIKGDKQHACRTLPIIWGIRRTKKLLYVLIAFFVANLFFLAGKTANNALLLCFTALQIPMFFLVYKIVYADKRRDFTFLSQICKIIMLLGIGSMAVV